MAKTRREPEPSIAPGGLGMFQMIQEPLARMAWGYISEAVRSAGSQILKNPRGMAQVLRSAAAALDKYADEKGVPK